MFDSLRYLRENHIPYWTEGKNVSPGWVNITCPLCGDESNHGGFSPEGQYVCWRCSWHPVEEVIMVLEKIPYHKACKITAQYQTASKLFLPSKKIPIKEDFKFPVGTGKLNKEHKKYLIDRKFDPDFLENKYGLKGTGPVGELPHRIIIPIEVDKEVISWQSRDITGRAKLRYKSCPKNMEKFPHKHTLYNIDNCYEKAVVVEGVTDVWRLGNGAVATFGTAVTKQQLILLSKMRRVLTIFDQERTAQKAAVSLCLTLSSMGVDCENITIEVDDPAQLTEEEAKSLMEDLI